MSLYAEQSQVLFSDGIYFIKKNHFCIKRYDKNQQMF